MFFNSCRAGSDPRRLLPAIVKSSAHLLGSEEPEILAAYRRHVILSAAESVILFSLAREEFEPQTSPAPPPRLSAGAIVAKRRGALVSPTNPPR
jgi:hypothetical protein